MFNRVLPFCALYIRQSCVLHGLQKQKRDLKHLQFNLPIIKSKFYFSECILLIFTNDFNDIATVVEFNVARNLSVYLLILISNYFVIK